MWFKNLQLFKLSQAFPYNGTELDEQLQAFKAKPCPSTQETTYGWTSPFGRQSDVLVHSSGPFLLIAACREDRLLPASVVKETVEQRVEEIEAQQARQVFAKEKAALREEIRFSLLPKAFTKKKITYAYIDTKNGWLAVDTSSHKAAEQLTEYLRKTLGTLKLAPPELSKDMEPLMSHWLINNQLPMSFSLEQDCEMLDTTKSQGNIKFRGQDLSGTAVTNHLRQNKHVTKLGLSWQGKLSFMLNNDLSLHRIRFLDILKDAYPDMPASADGEVDEAAMKLDADFTLMTAEFTQLIDDLVQTFGGLSGEHEVESSNTSAETDAETQQEDTTEPA